jgi:GcrA cell cycle regulator
MSANCATWTSERIELLKRCLHAGLSCGQTAREIGVTRNAVIGKMNRLGLSRPKDVIGRQLEQRRAARLARPKTPRTWRSKSPRLNIFAQHEMLMVTFRRPQPPAEDIPIYNGRGCTLLELSQGKCRWPISNPGAEDFCFCGNEPVKGLPYCPGHARIAYRSVGRQRSARVREHTTAAAPPRDAMFARLHSITSSARASSAGGNVKPSALAVFRLITVSYLVGACTGRSAGFSPLRMRST